MNDTDNDTNAARIPRYRAIARALDAYKRCIKTRNHEWEMRWNFLLNEFEVALPSGAGFDAGSLDRERSDNRRLVFHTSYHHMDDLGYYGGWTSHTIYVWADLGFEFDLNITGKDRNNIKDFIADVFGEYLNEPVPQYGVLKYLEVGRRN